MKEGKANVMKMYSEFEEKLNIRSHAIGIVLSIIALFFLIQKAGRYQDPLQFISFIVFGFSMLSLYIASTTYHSATDLEKRFKLKIFDHISIFIFIAGSYTPYALVTLQGKIGWIVLGVVWGVALFGSILKIFFTGRFKLLSTLLYVAMGWIVVFSYKTLAQNLSEDGLFWLLAGGAAYTIGAIFYSIGRLKFNHAIFHVFVLLGSLCHFISIYFYV